MRRAACAFLTLTVAVRFSGCGVTSMAGMESVIASESSGASKPVDISRELQAVIVALRGDDVVAADQAAQSIAPRYLRMEGYGSRDARFVGPRGEKLVTDPQPAAAAIIDAATRWPEVDSFPAAAMWLTCPKDKGDAVSSLLDKALERKSVSHATSWALLWASLDDADKVSLPKFIQMAQHKNKEIAIGGLKAIVRMGQRAKPSSPQLQDIVAKTIAKPEDAAHIWSLYDGAVGALAAAALANMDVDREKMLGLCAPLEKRQADHVALWEGLPVPPPTDFPNIGSSTYRPTIAHNLGPCALSNEMRQFLDKGDSIQALLAMRALEARITTRLWGEKGRSYLMICCHEKGIYCETGMSEDTVKQILALRDSIFMRTQTGKERDEQVRSMAHRLMKLLAFLPAAPHKE